MTTWAEKEVLQRQGLYDAANEHDACGVGFVAHIKGQRAHGIVEQRVDQRRVRRTAFDRRGRRHVDDPVAVGFAGQLHPAVVERAGLPKGTCAAELDLDAIPIVETLPAPRVSPFPAVFQDLSLVVDDTVPADAVIAAVRAGAGELLEDVELFDVYSGPQIGAGRTSLTLAMRFRAADRTLTEDEASAARDAAVAVAEALGAELRR